MYKQDLPCLVYIGIYQWRAASFLKVSCAMLFNTQFYSPIPEAWNLSPALNEILFAEIEKKEKQKWACLTESPKCKFNLYHAPFFLQDM